MAYVKNIVINCNPDGTFASATKQEAGVMGDGEYEIPQPNVSVELKEVKAIVGALKG